MADAFWAAISAQLDELTHAKTATEVVAILSAERDPYHTVEGGEKRNLGDNGFFAGSGGDDTVRAALREAGWKVIWSEASYYYAMRAPDGSVITYIEGDIYPRDTRDDGVHCQHCGNKIALRHDPTGQRGEAWAEMSWGDDRDFQCGVNPDSNLHEPNVTKVIVSVTVEVVDEKLLRAYTSGFMPNAVNVADHVAAVVRGTHTIHPDINGLRLVPQTGDACSEPNAT